MNSATGGPISGALVILYPGTRREALGSEQDQAPAGTRLRALVPGTGPPGRALTDLAGKFSFSLPAPPFARIESSRRGFQSESGGDTNMVGLSGEDLEKDADVTIKLVPAAAVEGKVVNEDGEPLPGATVQLVSVTIAGGRRITRSGFTAITNDLGEFRLWHLPAGLDYLKLFGRRGEAWGAGAIPAVAFPDESYGPVYYPAAPSLAAAQPLQIRAGETIRADFAVQARKAYKIWGTIGNAPAGVVPTIRLLRDDDDVGGRILFSTSTHTFEAADVTPGAYTIQAYATQSADRWFGEMVVTVGEGDVSGVDISMSTGVDVKGTIQFPSADSDSGRPRFVLVQAQNNNPSRLPFRTDVNARTVDAAGNFTLNHLLPGVYTLTVTPGSGYVASAWLGADDVLASGLTIGVEAPADTLQIVLKTGGGQIDGTVEGQTPDESATVVAVRRYGSSIIPAVISADPDGLFEADDLAPGDYRIYAWPASRQVEYYSPAALEALSSTAVSISLAPNAQGHVSVKLARENHP
ncbi:MAG: carboxypeptidase-like regulatory domain-containing protein [Bryobacteraceae bacterium]